MNVDGSIRSFTKTDLNKEEVQKLKLETGPTQVNAKVEATIRGERSYYATYQDCQEF